MLEFNKGFWFLIEPYVFVSVVEGKALLYNTLDGKVVESVHPKVIDLLLRYLKK